MGVCVLKGIGVSVFEDFESVKIVDISHVKQFGGLYVFGRRFAVKVKPCGLNNGVACVVKGCVFHILTFEAVERAFKAEFSEACDADGIALKIAAVDIGQGLRRKNCVGLRVSYGVIVTLNAVNKEGALLTYNEDVQG